MVGNSVNHHVTLIKFNGDNYNLWKYQMRHVLRSHGLLGQVDGTKPKPAEADALEKWDKDDAEAFILLFGEMRQDLAAEVASLDTAKELWDALSRKCEQKSAENKVMIMQRFQACNMTHDESVSSYISRLRSLKKSLEDVDETVSETAFMAKILGVLPPKFQTFKTSWRNVEPTRQRIDFMEERLMTEEQDMQQEEEPGAVALYTGNGRSQKTGAKSHVPQRQVSDPAKKVRQNHSKIICRKCKEAGHIARFCSQKGGNAEKNNNKSVVFVSSVHRGFKAGSSETFGAAEFENLNVSEICLTDCGASGNITFRRD